MAPARTSWFALIAAAASAWLAWAAFAQPVVALRGLLCGWLFFIGMSVGASMILLVQRLTGGRWIGEIRRYLVAATRALPLLSILLIPVVVGAQWLFPWASSHSGSSQHPWLDWYLRPFSFAMRAAIYVLLWNVIAARARTAEQSGTAATAVALLVQALTLSFAAIDLIASREPHWTSSVFGMTVIVGEMLGAFAFAVCCAASEEMPVDTREDVARSNAAGDLGNLLLTLVLTWTYLAFMQFLIIWAEDLPRETSWYMHRMHDGWLALGVGVTLLQFVLPFALLLSRALKRNFHALGSVAALLVIANWLDCVWLVGPTLDDQRPFHALDFIATIAIGGWWAYVVLHVLRARSDETSQRPNGTSGGALQHG